MRVTLLLFIVFSFISVQSQTDDIKDVDRIYWSDWYKLEWTDFKGEEKAEKSVAAISKIALPYTVVSDGEVDMTVSLQVCFIKSESWYKAGKDNPVLLQHEQLHFDIAELHRRIVVKELLGRKFSHTNYKQELASLIEEVWNTSYTKMQDKYDQETNYFRNFRAQINWNRMVAQQLRNLEEYTFTEVTVTFKD